MNKPNKTIDYVQKKKKTKVDSKKNVLKELKNYVLKGKQKRRPREDKELF